MMKSIERGVLSALAASALVLIAGTSRAADPPPTADVLGKLHRSDQKEIEAGKLAQRNGKSKQVKDYGKMLVKDHSAADKKVTALAKEEKVDLEASTPAAKGDGMSGMASDPEFDTKFASEMVDDHKKDIAEVTDARDSTTDPKLKKLLTDLVPTLQKHEDTAQRIVDSTAVKK